MRINKSLITYQPSSGAGSGTVTSVALSAPTGFTVSGSPITTSGTLALAFASGYSLPTTAKQTEWDTAYTLTLGAALTKVDDTNVTLTLGGTPNTSILRATSLTLGWSGQLAVGRGGTGASTLTGVVIGNATSAMTAVGGTAGQFLRRNTANTAYEFKTLQGGDIAGSELTFANDTNVTMTLGGTPASALLQPVSINLGWSGQLAVGRGGTGASTLSGVLIGNGTSAVSGVTGTSGQLLRRNIANTAYEFFTASLITGNGVANFVPIWTSETNILESPLSFVSGEANFGNNKLVAGNVSSTNGSIMLQDNYSLGHFSNVGTMFSGGNLMLGYGVTPSTSSATSFLSSVFVSGSSYPRSSIVIGENVSIYTGAAQSVAIGSSVTMSEKFSLLNSGQLRLLSYTSTSSFTGTTAGYLGFTSTGYITTTTISGSDVTGAAISTSNDTNITISASGNTSNALLRTLTLTTGWSGQLPVPRGGTGVSTMTGVVVGNGIGVMTGVVGTASQLLRRDATNSFYEFFTHDFLSNPMTTLSDIIVANAAGAPIRLAANTTSDNLYLRTVSGAIGYAAIQGSHIVGAGLTSTNDTNITITLGGTPSNSVLRSVSMTMGWSGTLSTSRGGTGTSGLTGIIYGNGASAMTAITGVGGQILRIAPITTAYEFWTPTYLDNVMTSLGDIIYGNASGAPIRLAANSTASNMFLRSVSSGAPSWAAISGADITGAALTTANDTNILITASGNTTNALLRTLTLTAGWTGILAPTRGGTGASTITGVVIGNGIGTMVGVAGTADQLLRRNSANTAYEFFTPTYLSNPMTSLGDIIYGNAAGAPLRLAANSSGSNQYLRSVSSGAPAWASIDGSDITGAAITTANDTNILITASGNTSSALLRTLTLTAGWTGSLAVGRGGTGSATLTGVLIGNGTSAVTGITGTASQLLRRNAGDSAYEFFTPNFTTGSGTTNYVPIWSSGTVLADSPLSITGSEANFGSNKLVAGNVSATNGSIILQDNYSSGHFSNIGTMYSGGSLMLGYGVTPSTSSATDFLSSVFISGVPFPRYANVLGTDVVWYAGAAQSVAIGSSITMSERMRLTNAGTLQITTGNLQLNTATNITWGGAYGTDIPTISGTSGSGSNGFLQFYPAGSTSGVKMALRRTGQLALPSYTSSTAFTGTSVATLAVDAAGDVITIAPQQVTASGTYTPTWTGLANVDSVTAYSCQYMRVGDTVTVSGVVGINATVDNTPTSLSLSIPINSDIATISYCAGTGVDIGGGPAASIVGYGSNFAEFAFIPAVDTNVNYSFHFTYRIV